MESMSYGYRSNLTAPVEFGRAQSAHCLPKLRRALSDVETAVPAQLSV